MAQDIAHWVHVCGSPSKRIPLMNPRITRIAPPRRLRGAAHRARVTYEAPSARFPYAGIRWSRLPVVLASRRRHPSQPALAVAHRHFVLCTATCREGRATAHASAPV